MPFQLMRIITSTTLRLKVICMVKMLVFLILKRLLSRLDSTQTSLMPLRYRIPRS